MSQPHSYLLCPCGYRMWILGLIQVIEEHLEEDVDVDRAPTKGEFETQVVVDYIPSACLTSVTPLAMVRQIWTS